MEKIRPAKKRKKFTIAKDERECEIWRAGGLICGIDEVGRGCLAGPVVTAALILCPNTRSKTHLRDSKTMNRDELQKAARYIRKRSWYAYGVASPAEIDQFNIYRATQRAMKRAVLQLCAAVGQLPAEILVDAMPLQFDSGPLADIKSTSLIYGESYSSSIAAASIMAKVKRDELMVRMARSWGQYGFDEHVGYATVKHQQAVRTHGSSVIHRESFLKKLRTKMLEESCEKQRTLFG